MKHYLASLMLLAACKGNLTAPIKGAQAASLEHHRIQCRNPSGAVVVDTVDVDAPPSMGTNYWQWRNGDGHLRSVSVPPLICLHEAWVGEQNTNSLIPLPAPTMTKPLPEAPLP